jgi:hypothetical protein
MFSTKRDFLQVRVKTRVLSVAVLAKTDRGICA